MRKKIKKAVGGTIESKKLYRGMKLEDGSPVIFSREGMISDIQADEIADLEMQKRVFINQHNAKSFFLLPCLHLFYRRSSWIYESFMC